MSSTFSQITLTAGFKTEKNFDVMLEFDFLASFSEKSWIRSISYASRHLKHARQVLTRKFPPNPQSARVMFCRSNVPAKSLGTSA